MIGLFFLCAKEGVFDKDCQVISLANGDDLANVAQKWAATNGYDKAFVYNMKRLFMFSA